jgi:hypothetical protein
MLNLEERRISNNEIEQMNIEVKHKGRMMNRKAAIDDACQSILLTSYFILIFDIQLFDFDISFSSRLRLTVKLTSKKSTAPIHDRRFTIHDSRLTIHA